MYKIKIATIKEFEESREAWNKLALAMSFPSIFCTWEWIYTWWEHFGRDYEPVILFIYKDAELVGILPLAYHKTSNGILTGRRLSYCGSMELYPDHLDIICAKEDAEKCLDAVFEFLRSEFKDWDVLHISLLSEGSNLILYTNTNPVLTIAIKSNTSAPFIALNGSFDDYISTFGSKKRYNLKRDHKILLQTYKVEYTSCDPSQITEGIKTLFHLHELRAKTKKITSTFKGERIFNFHNTFADRISKNAWLSLRFLRKSSGEIISAFYGFALDGHLFYYQLGIDPEWEPYSPGTVLFYEVIKEAFSKGLKEFDFLRGNEEYKSRWAKEHRMLYTAAIYNKTIRANILKTTSQSKNLLKRALKKTIS